MVSMQPFLQTVVAFINQAVFSCHAFLAWMISCSSQVSQALFAQLQAYFSVLGTGYPAATPRPLAQARSQTIGFYRTMAGPAMRRIRNWFLKTVKRR
jgi:hypothetical protein